MRIMFASLLVVLLSACDGALWNNPYPAASQGKSIFYTAFTERPKHLDPAQAYSENEYEFLAQIYQPPLQYHYLKRPYTLVPQAAGEMPRVTYLDKNNRPLPDDAPADKVAFSVYEIHLRQGLKYQPHPAFARDAQGKPEYFALTPHDLRDIHALNDFPHSGTREVKAADYVYQIKRLVHPNIHSPIAGLMAEYIVGLKDYAATLQQAQKAHPDVFLDLHGYPLEGAQAVDEHTYRIKVYGKYPQFAYWLAMPFFAPMPVETERFYAQDGMRVLKRFGYAPHGRADKGVLLRYIERMTGLSRQQVTRLVRQYRKDGNLSKQPCAPKYGFTYRYTADFNNLGRAA